MGRILVLMFLVAAAGCERGPNPNVVDDYLLRPALLREDPNAVSAYMAKLPEGV